MKNSYRIISIEASDIYKSERENGDNVGYKMPEYKSYAYFRLFKNKLDYSLDSIELKKHMLLLRNKFFKTCAFRTKLQKWIKDKRITLADLKARGFITLATDISQIIMVTTPNSLKYLKFASGFTESNIRKWADKVSSVFGVVKWDKRTRYFGGRMVQSNYQLLNSVFLSENECEKLLAPSIEYIKTIRDDADFMRYHFSTAYAREKDASSRETDDELVDRADIIFSLLAVCNGIR